MLERFVRAAAVGAVLLLLAAQLPAAAQQKPRPGTVTPASSRTPAEDTEVDFVESDQAVWNARSINDSIFQDGASVNSVMFEKKAVRDLRRADFLPKTKVEDVQVKEPMTTPSVIRIQGKPVQLPSTTP